MSPDTPYRFRDLFMSSSIVDAEYASLFKLGCYTEMYAIAKAEMKTYKTQARREIEAIFKAEIAELEITTGSTLFPKKRSSNKLKRQLIDQKSQEFQHINNLTIADIKPGIAYLLASVGHTESIQSIKQTDVSEDLLFDPKTSKFVLEVLSHLPHCLSNLVHTWTYNAYVLHAEELVTRHHSNFLERRSQEYLNYETAHTYAYGARLVWQRVFQEYADITGKKIEDLSLPPGYMDKLKMQ